MVTVDGAWLRETAERIQRRVLEDMTDPEMLLRLTPRMLQPKGRTDLETVLRVSVIDPIGVPREEAVYPAVGTVGGEQMNAMHDYVIRMTRDELPPAGAFWSLTLYDLDQGFFIPNDRRKYSVGENAGMELNANGGIEIYVAAEQPAGVPAENWLPIERRDQDLNLILRIYVPDLERMKTWTPPRAEWMGG